VREFKKKRTDRGMGMRTASVIRILIVVAVVAYCLPHYTTWHRDGPCRCGCQEDICSCCRTGQHLGETRCVIECCESSGEDSYEQSRPLGVPAFQFAITLDPLGQAGSSRDDSARAGYRDPPMKPPPSNEMS
jgi:hypothetical protein